MRLHSLILIFDNIYDIVSRIMTTESHESPASSPVREHNLEETVDRLQQLLQHVDLESLLVDAERDESTPGQTVYLFENNPVMTGDEVAVVDYDDTAIEDDHMHLAPEREAHMIVPRASEDTGEPGRITYVIDGEPEEIVPGDSIVTKIIDSNTPHFAYTHGKPVRVVVVSSPGFDEDRMVRLSPESASLPELLTMRIHEQEVSARVQDDFDLALAE